MTGLLKFGCSQHQQTTEQKDKNYGTESNSERQV